MDSGLSNRVVLVTGAAGGIGQEVVRAFRREGAQVIAHFRSQAERAVELAREAGPAAKAGLTYGLTRTLKNEMCRLAPRGRVNVVCPGWTFTPMTRRLADDAPRVRRVLQTIPLRKVGRPQDVAAAIVYLASSRLAGHLTGQILTVAGGMEGRMLYQPDEIDPTQA